MKIFLVVLAIVPTLTNAASVECVVDTPRGQITEILNIPTDGTESTWKIDENVFRQQDGDTTITISRNSGRITLMSSRIIWNGQCEKIKEGKQKF